MSQSINQPPKGTPSNTTKNLIKFNEKPLPTPWEKTKNNERQYRILNSCSEVDRKQINPETSSWKRWLKVKMEIFLNNMNKIRSDD